MWNSSKFTISCFQSTHGPVKISRGLKRNKMHNCSQPMKSSGHQVGLVNITPLGSHQAAAMCPIYDDLERKAVFSGSVKWIHVAGLMCFDKCSKVWGKGWKATALAIPSSETHAARFHRFHTGYESSLRKCKGWHGQFQATGKMQDFTCNQLCYKKCFSKTDIKFRGAPSIAKAVGS